MRARRGVYRIPVGNPEEGDNLEDPGVDATNWIGGIDWNDLPQDRGRWQIPVNAVMNLRVPLNRENFLTS
jgi:hypothetical protein